MLNLIRHFFLIKLATMSGDGSTASPTAMPFSTPPRSSRRKAEAENWDDDFEFALSSRPSSKTSSSQSKTAEKRRSSPVESLSEWWDESPPAPSRGRPAKAPSPLNLPAPTAQPPSLSPSQTTSLPPTPHTASRKPQIPFLSPPQAYAELGLPLLTPNASRPRSNSAASTTTRNKLIKRHPSSSAIPIPISPGNSRYPFGNSSLPSLPHPPLPRSDSGERMPPPPVPTSLTRTRQSQAKRFASRSEVRVSSIPFSLSQDAMREKETEVRRFSLWKRLSWVSPSRKQRGEASPLIHWSRSDPVIEEDSTDLRRRTSSLGNHHPDMTVASPSFPSIHLDLRSSSAVSSDSTPSASTSSSGPHSIMHRSTSNLFRRAENRKSSPPPSYPYQMNDDRSSSTLLQSPPTASPFARSVSRGFHLPSPSPWSPYHGGIIPGEGGTPPLPHSSSFLLALLPHSNSFPAPRHGRGDRSDTETETEKDDATPKRRRKSRPVSALPPTRTSSRTSWEVEGWNGFNREMTGPTSPRRVSSGSDSNGFVATTTSTLKKLGSLSKKHGRRLSGGFKFGTDSSSSSNESRSAAMGLETIEGSPSKPLRNRDGISSSSDLDEDFRSAVRAGSVSAPSSVIKPPIPEESSKAQEKQRRRQSWNDFVIPQEVLEKQKGVRKGIATAKRFAGGVESESSVAAFVCTLLMLYSSQYTVRTARHIAAKGIK
jgi:hypothetical protein